VFGKKIDPNVAKVGAHHSHLSQRSRQAQSEGAEGAAPPSAGSDLVNRWKNGAPVNPPDMDTFYTPGPKGHTDYPTL